MSKAPSALQPTLPGVPVKIPAAYRGKEFEFLLDGQHRVYKAQRIALMYHNPTEWNATHAEHYNSVAKDPKRAYTVARTGRGSFIKAVKSPVDFGGVVKPGIAVWFDAKMSKGKSIPLDNFKQHQIDFTLERQTFGAIAGFMIWFTDVGRFFFLWASYVEQCMTLALIKRDRKSIAIAQCEDHGREIFLDKYNYPDWVSVLVPNNKKEK